MQAYWPLQERCSCCRRCCGQFPRVVQAGVRFYRPPEAQTWGGMETNFEDPDGNSLVLVGYDAATREFEAQRRAAQELEIAKQVQARLFPQMLPQLPSLDYTGICIQARQVGGDHYDL